MPQGPPKSDQRISYPAMAGKRSETRSKVSVIGELLGDRPDGPSDEPGIEHGPNGQVAAQELPVRDGRTPRVLSNAVGEKFRLHESWKNQQETSDAFGNQPARDRTKKIANTKVFAPG
jgi:hypothetical protein